MGDLLSKRRYRWISRKQAIYSCQAELELGFWCRGMLDKLLPELSADVADHIEDLQLLMKHLDSIQKDFHSVHGREC